MGDVLGTQEVSIWNKEENKAITVTTDGAKERLDVSTGPLTLVTDSLKPRLHFDTTDIVVTVPLSGDMRSSIKRVSDSYAVSQSDILRGSIILGLPLLIGLFEQKALLYKFVAALGLDLLTDYVGKVSERR